MYEKLNELKQTLYDRVKPIELKSLSSLISLIAYLAVVPQLQQATRYECHSYFKDGIAIQEVVQIRRVEGLEGIDMIFRINTKDPSLPDFVLGAPKCEDIPPKKLKSK